MLPMGSQRIGHVTIIELNRTGGAPRGLNSLTLTAPEPAGPGLVLKHYNQDMLWE